MIRDSGTLARYLPGTIAKPCVDLSTFAFAYSVREFICVHTPFFFNLFRSTWDIYIPELFLNRKNIFLFSFDLLFQLFAPLFIHFIYPSYHSQFCMKKIYVLLTIRCFTTVGQCFTKICPWRFYSNNADGDRCFYQIVAVRVSNSRLILPVLCELSCIMPRT